MENIQTKTSPKDVFINLGGLVTLYVTAISAIALLFQFINYWFPDPVSSYVNRDAVRWAIASAVIMFPLHVILTKLIFKDQAQFPEKREGRLRKWIIYITLFFSALALAADLIVLIYNFLNGELSARFYLKVLSVGLVAGGVFWYYLWDLRRVVSEISSRSRSLLWLGIVLVAVLVVASVLVTGSPFRERQLKFDSQRVGDLGSIQYQLINYWQLKGQVPATLDLLKNDISGFAVPVDPETKRPYEYRKTGNLNFELCATFNLPSEAQPVPAYLESVPYPYSGQNNWNHGSGRQCFSRTIDPELYPRKTPAEIPAKPL